jgi:hypothetical protein
MCCSVVFAIVANVIAQSNSTFAPGEAQRVYDLLDGLGCIGNEGCGFNDFTPTTACDYKSDVRYEIRCRLGRLEHL